MKRRAKADFEANAKSIKGKESNEKKAKKGSDIVFEANVKSLKERSAR